MVDNNGVYIQRNADPDESNSSTRRLVYSQLNRWMEVYYHWTISSLWYIEIFDIDPSDYEEWKEKILES